MRRRGEEKEGKGQGKEGNAEWEGLQESWLRKEELIGEIKGRKRRRRMKRKEVVKSH